MTDAAPTTENESQSAEAVEVEVEVASEATDKAGVLAWIREAGESGKKDWEEGLAKVREGVRKQSSALYGKAQERGADLLLRLASRVRQGAEALEKSIEAARKPEASAEAPAAA